MMRNQKGFVLGLFAVFAGLQAVAGNVAVVNGKAITDEDLNQLVANMPVQQRNMMLKEPAMRNQLVQSLIDQELLVQDAVARKLDASKEFRDAYNQFRKQSLATLLVEKQLSPKVTDAAAKEHYNRNKVRYSTDQIHAQHILVSTEKEAEAVLAEVKRPGVDFQKVAELRSKDPSAKNNRGDLGFFARENFDIAFVDAAFGAKPNEIVGPVKTNFGYHVIKVIERKVGNIPEYTEVEAKVRSDLQREVLENYLRSLRSKAKVKR